MKMYRLLFLVGLLALGTLQRGYAQYVTWSRPLTPGLFSTRSVTDAAGNTYVAGSYRGTRTMGATTLPDPTGPLNVSNAYVAKIDPQGLVQWAIAGVSARADEVLELALAPGGNVYVAFKAGLDSMNQTPGTNYPFALGGLTVASGGILLATVSPSGTVGALTYLHQGGTNAEITGMAVDAAGNALLSVVGNSGNLFAAYTFPAVGTGYTLSSAIFRASPGATPVLVRSLVPTSAAHLQPGYYYLRAEDLATDAAGNIYCVGQLGGTAVLGTAPAVTLNATTGFGGFVAKFSAAGVAQWGLTNDAPANGANFTGYHSSLAVAPTGEVYVAGSSVMGNFGYGGLGILPQGGYVLKLSASGTPLWARSAQTSPGNDRGSFVRIALDAAGNVYRLGLFEYATVSFGTTVLNNPVTTGGISYPGGIVRPGAFYVVSYDAAGALRWARAVDAQQTPAPQSYHYSSGLGVDTGGNVYLLANTGVPLLIDNEVLGAGYTLLQFSPASRLSGMLYIDQNNNGQRDTGEVPFPYAQVISNLTQTAAYSSAPGTGQYSFYGLPGTAYGVTVPSPHPYYTLHTPTLRTGTFPALGQAVTGQDFGLVPNDNQTDVRVTLTSYSAARPGFTTRYRLTLENIGTTVASGNASVTLDSRATYVASAPAGTRSGQVVTWAYTNLAPFAHLDYDVTFSLPTNATLGAVLSSTAAAPLTGDVDASNNTATTTQTVTGSYDPNDITVNYDRLSPAQVAAALPLDYVIRFQNMGTDTAFTVVITDVLNAQRLNLGTMELIAQSHNCLWSLTGNGLLTVRFPNIKLPHRNVDVIRSQGFVRFRVRPRPTLAVGDIVPNNADIFFDYNAPVRTNTATTTVMLASAALASHTAEAWNAYPNPATDAVTVAADLKAAGPVRLDLLDALGRTVRHETLTAPAGPLRQTLDLRGLAPGFYVLRLTPPTGPASSQQLVRE